MKKTILFAIGLMACISSFAQPSLATLAETIKKQRQEHLYDLRLTSTTQGALQISATSRLTKDGAKAWLASSLGLRRGKDDLQKLPGSKPYAGDVEIEKYHQYYKGIKVEHGFANVVSKAGSVRAVQLEFYSLDETLATVPTLTEGEAFQKALSYVGAARYVWDGYTGTDPERKKPSGSLVIVEDYYGKKGRLHLAYKFEIFAEQPLSRSYVYVDAGSGKLLLIDKIIKHLSPDMDGGNGNVSVPEDLIGTTDAKPFVNTTATAQTRYSGPQNLMTDDGSTVTGKPYRLRQVRNGHDIITLNYERRVRSSANDALAIDFTDNDNNWTNTENSMNYDDAALDAQYALQWVSDYWKNVHNRNSWDNAGGQMKSYVHVRSSANAGYDNAFWSGSAMYYGDGTYYSADGLGTVANASGFKPLTSLDVSAHELGHAVCQTTAQLVYQRESGGMNEGFSDIWAACVENYSGLPKSPFLVGEEIIPGGALRSMQNPKLYGNPDTYGGQYWIRTSLASCALPGTANDQCGVHYNSGLLNKWFYLITQGGTGTNDNQDSYSVTGLGFTKSEKIAFLLEQSLTPNADYAAARVAAINAATTLYGACSNEVVQVANAWFAVGVGASAACSPVVEFAKTTATCTEGNGLAGNCSNTKIISVPVKLAAVATQKTDVQFSFGGTAVQGVHYSVSSPTVTFNTGESGTKNLDITILDNATVDGAKTLALTFTVNANGGNGTAGINNQAYTLTITDDDALPLPIKSAPVSTVTLLNENFETSAPGTVFPSGWNGTLAFGSGASATNVWAIGSGAGAGLTGNAAYISNTATGAIDYAYSTTSATDRLLRLPVLNTTGLTDIRFQFKYKVGGEVDPLNPASTDPNYWPALWDYARILYDANGTGTSFNTLFNNAANDYFALNGNGTTTQTFPSFRLPSNIENKAAVYLGFRWVNDDYAGNGFPLAVDDILVTGRTMGTSIETAVGQSNSVRVLTGNADTYIASGAGNNLLAKLSNVSQSLSCLTASLVQAGSGRVTINTNRGSFFRTEKIIQLTPAVPNTTTAYNAMFYFTAADLSAWSSAEIPLLKILKVKDGVDLNGTLSASDAELITPTFTDNSGNGYYSYSGNFTGFSRFMLVSPTFILPVNLLTFEAHPTKKAIALSWTTASESNNKGFEVQRNTTGSEYASIGWVAGTGTTTAKKAYQFQDNYVQSNTVYYYRLKQVDGDNRTRYSAVRKAALAEEGITVSVSPNPASSVMKIFVAGVAQPADASLVNAKGEQVAVWKNLAPGSTFQTDISRFAKGIYSLVVHLPNGDKTTKVILQ